VLNGKSLFRDAGRAEIVDNPLGVFGCLFDEVLVDIVATRIGL